MSRLVFVLNGPNLNPLGRRQPHIYGHETLEMVKNRCLERGAALGLEVEVALARQYEEVMALRRQHDLLVREADFFEHLARKSLLRASIGKSSEELPNALPCVLEEPLVPFVLEVAGTHGDWFWPPDGRLIHDAEAHQPGPRRPCPAEAQFDGSLALHRAVEPDEDRP